VYTFSNLKKGEDFMKQKTVHGRNGRFFLTTLGVGDLCCPPDGIDREPLVLTGKFLHPYFLTTGGGYGKWGVRYNG